MKAKTNSKKLATSLGGEAPEKKIVFKSATNEELDSYYRMLHDYKDLILTFYISSDEPEARTKIKIIEIMAERFLERFEKR